MERDRRNGRRGREIEKEMVSQKAIKKQVQEEGRVVDLLCQRRLMDKRACENTLGGQTHCQTHRRQTCEGKEEDQRERESLCSWMEESSLSVHNTALHIKSTS